MQNGFIIALLKTDQINNFSILRKFQTFEFKPNNRSKWT